MTKALKDMTDEERWALFPILLEPYRPEWPQIYQTAEKQIERRCHKAIARINHIGSTAVPGLMAKPTIDILIELKADADIDAFRDCMKALGYMESNYVTQPELHLMFLRGYTQNGFEEQAFHVHVRHAGNWKELYFRDYLRDHPEVCRAYEALKQDLMTQYRHHRDHYTEGKTEFITRYSDEAMRLYPDRYMIKG